MTQQLEIADVRVKILRAVEIIPKDELESVWEYINSIISKYDKSKKTARKKYQELKKECSKGWNGKNTAETISEMRR